ncbi:MAG: glycosyltransferase [Rhodospirillaceae bacterium]|jgi:glycosyltransferase involved in cell wall biosynthesis|nr:glycosyltransferase [Rhodospirillaceae bacterium]
MTRLLQAMAGATHGGAEAFFERFAPALNRAGVEQRVVIRRDSGRAARLRAAGIEPVQLRFGGRLDFATSRALRRQVRAFDPDIVLGWMSRGARFCPRGRHVLAARLGGYYDLKYFRHCDHLIGNTRDIADYLVKAGWPAERTHYLPNFVDGAPSPAADRSALDTPADAPLLLALGRLHTNKAFDVLIASLAALPAAWLWIAGEGPLRAELEAQAQALGVDGRLRFLGWRHDMPALLAAADILVCSSRHEPLGNVVIEGWAHDRPVVATRSAGPAALIADGSTGLLVDIDDPSGLSAALARVLESADLRAGLVAGGRAAYEAEFTEAAVVARYLDFFDRIRA